MNHSMLFASSVIMGVAYLHAQPAADHHSHLLRSTVAPPEGFVLNAEDLVRQMDEAGIRRGVVLSVAYQFGNPFRPAVASEYERVKAENDWTATQAALYSDRLVAFCGVNPLKDYALQEIDRCARNPGLRRGLKLHFGNSDVELDKPGYVAQMQRVFAAANRHHMAIVVHVPPNMDRGRSWGARQARIFLETSCRKLRTLWFRSRISQAPGDMTMRGWTKRWTFSRMPLRPGTFE